MNIDAVSRSIAEAYGVERVDEFQILVRRVIEKAVEQMEPAIYRIDAPDSFWFQDMPDYSENDAITSTPLYSLEGLK